MSKKGKNFVKILMVSLMVNFMGATTDNQVVMATGEKVTVIKDNHQEYYETIQAAIDSVGNGESAIIEVPQGNYDERVTIANSTSKARSISLRGAQADNSGYLNGTYRNSNETILTGGIEVNGILNSDSLEINGFTLHQKGMNILGWGAPIQTTGNLKIVNNVITDIADKATSAIHINCAGDGSEYIGTLDISHNYINNIGEEDYATNGIYATVAADNVNIIDNYISNVNHSSIQLANATIKTQLSILNNHIENWNKDGIAGTGASGSQGDGIYLPKGNISNSIPVEVHNNYIVRDENLSGSKGYAVRCGYNKGAINLAKNYWGVEFPFTVISGGTSPNVTINSICDENLVVQQQSIGNFTFSVNTLYKSGTTKEGKLSPTITMLDKAITEKPKVNWTSDNSEVVKIEERDGNDYYVAMRAGTTTLKGQITDPKSHQIFTIENEIKVIDIKMNDVTIETNEQIQMNLQVLPESETIGNRKIEWKTSDESIATVDNQGLVTSTGKKGNADITVIIYLYSFGNSIYAQKTATVTVGKSIPIEELKMEKNKVLKKGDSYNLNIEILPNDTTDDKTITWQSSDETVATVDSQGKINALRNGTVTITASVGDKSAQCEVSVYEVKEPEVLPVQPNQPTENTQIGINDQASQNMLANITEDMITNIVKGQDIDKDIVDAKTLTAVKEAVAKGQSITTQVMIQVLDEKKMGNEVTKKITDFVATLSDQNKTDTKITQYLDLSILLTTNEGKILGNIHKLDKPITYTIVLPQGIDPTGKQFSMIRIHNGEVTKLPVVVHQDGTLSFETYQYSTFALVYETKTETIITPEKPNISKPNDTSPNQQTVKTNDSTNITLFILTASLALAGSIIIIADKKRKELLSK